MTMTTPGTTDLHPETTAFLATVRAHLSDLPEEERDELLDGLEADLSEQLAEGGTLPDPDGYAAELRAAAGLPAGPAAKARRRRKPIKGQLAGAPDDLRARWLELTRHNDLTRTSWSLLETLRPAWWVLRAWVAVTLVDVMSGGYENVTLVPSLGASLVGPAVLVVAIVVSTLIGLGRLWPGSGPDRTLLARLVLAGLNVFAVLVPFSFHYAGSRPEIYRPTYARAVTVENGPPVLRLGRDVVRNVYAYDAAGQPLQGVQLYDQEGRPIAVAPQSSMGRGAQREVTCPWFNGTTPLFNVFPLPQRSQRYGTCLGHPDPAKVGAQAFQEPPLASVPPATLPAEPTG